MSNDQALVQAEGIIQPQGMTTYMYGTHILVDLSGETLYALQSSTLDLSKSKGEYVDILGTKVPGYPLEGGPVYLDVTNISDMHFKPSVASEPIRVQTGHEFAIVLPDHAANSGYEWQLAQALEEQIVTLIKTEQKPASGYDTPGVATWYFKAVDQGETHIVLKESRRWEPGLPPAQTLTFTVIVI